MRLFKYLTPQRTDVLKNQCIRFSQVKYLNDPFEWLPFVNRLMSENTADNYYLNSIQPLIQEKPERKLNIDDIPEEFRHLIAKEDLDRISELPKVDVSGLFKSITKLFLSGTSEQLNVNISEIIKNSWNKYFGVLCLTQSHDNIPMWSHYASNHEGFVLEFDPEDGFFKQSYKDSGLFRQIREVRYAHNREQIDLLEGMDSENDMLNRLVDKILFTKSAHWSGEQEVRMIDKLSKHDTKLEFDDQEIYLFNFKPETIIAIYLGVNIRKETEDEINEMIKSQLFRHIKCYKGELDLKEYKINFKEA